MFAIKIVQVQQYVSYVFSASTITVVVVVVVVLVAVLVIVIGGWFFYGYKHPDTKSGRWIIEVCRIYGLGVGDR